MVFLQPEVGEFHQHSCDSEEGPVFLVITVAAHSYHLNTHLKGLSISPKMV